MFFRRKALVLGATLIITACGKSAATPTNNTVSVATAPTPAVSSTPTPIPFGKLGTASGVAVTVLAVGQRDRIGSSHRTAQGETFVTIRYDVKNLTSKPMARVERPEVTLRDPQGRSYSDDGAAGLTLADGGLADAVTDTNPNMTARVTSVWKVDKASFDPSKWTMVVATDPQLTFDLK